MGGVEVTNSPNDAVGVTPELRGQYPRHPQTGRRPQDARHHREGGNIRQGRRRKKRKCPNENQLRSQSHPGPRTAPNETKSGNESPSRRGGHTPAHGLSDREGGTSVHVRRRRKQSGRLRQTHSQTQPRPQTALDGSDVPDRTETSPEDNTRLNRIETESDKTGMERGNPGMRRVSPFHIGRPSVDRPSDSNKSSTTDRDSHDSLALVSDAVTSGGSMALSIDEGEIRGRGRKWFGIGGGGG